MLLCRDDSSARSRFCAGTLTTLGLTLSMSCAAEDAERATRSLPLAPFPKQRREDEPHRS